MSKKEDLIKKLCSKPTPKNFTTKELDTLMKNCGCEKYSGGRGSSLKYVHNSGRVLTFDGPHPGNELYTCMVKKVIKFLSDVREINI